MHLEGAISRVTDLATSAINTQMQIESKTTQLERIQSQASALTDDNDKKINTLQESMIKLQDAFKETNSKLSETDSLLAHVREVMEWRDKPRIRETKINMTLPSTETAEKLDTAFQSYFSRFGIEQTPSPSE